MGDQNKLLEVLSDYDNDLGLSRRELKEAISELSASGRRRKIQKSLDATISNQIFKFLIGLVVLAGLLVLMFMAGSRYLFQNQDFMGFIPQNYWKKKSTDFSKFFTTNRLNNKAISIGEIPAKKQGQSYYIQLAICRYEKCSNTYIKRASYLGLPYKVDNLEEGEKIIFKEIVSVQKMDLQKAQNLAVFINTVNERSGYANVVSSSNGFFYISLGSFPNADIAEDLRRYYDSLAASESVSFSYKESFTASSGGLAKILVGPFEKEVKVKEILKGIVKNKGLQSAFITVQ